MANKVRVRFAPSPTGGLHLGGVRTVLYNYLFARQHGGDFVLRIEDTDQSRFVAGAEEYIVSCLQWCGLEPDESPMKGGPHAPYRQSERKADYYQYAKQLVDEGYAYYAFDTPEELERMRNEFKSESGNTAQYDQRTRMHMRNSLTMGADETAKLIEAGTPYVIRIKMPAGENLSFTDMIRGEVHFDTSLVDDKVLLKADGMPTYHLAVVVDDYLMQITHAFRGEEWLPSAPVHLLLWKYLGWGDAMPQWAHMPLILKPDGHGKLSKRDGDRLGFPVFAMNWTDPKTGETTQGFKERGFLPEAFINMLAMLGWSSGLEQEIFSLGELVEKFSIERVHKGGAKFDYEKAKWFNHQYIQKLSGEQLTPLIKPYLLEAGIQSDDSYIATVADMIKERCTLLPDFVAQGSFFFKAPEEIDMPSITDKWNGAKKTFFSSFIDALNNLSVWNVETTEQAFNDCVQQQGIKKGEVMLPLRIMLVGGKFGPGVFNIAEMIGKEQTIGRIAKVIDAV
ncbi:MAG: glutamate--tRNA ligase [Sphingobacteriales bacterium]|nr:MAG: glutamate--tRNA ligase [Sphingobacteriales bacterium]